MTYILTQSPLTEPVTLAELKSHLKIDHTDEDTLLQSLIQTAREYLEHRAGLALMTQSWRLILDAWPVDGLVSLHKTPVQQLSAIEIYDADGSPQTVDISTTLLDGHSQPARLYIGAQQSPEQSINGIEITFSAGYVTASEVPDMLKRALLLHACHLYEFRGVVTRDMQPASVPDGYEALISPWCRRRL